MAGLETENRNLLGQRVHDALYWKQWAAQGNMEHGLIRLRPGLTTVFAEEPPTSGICDAETTRNNDVRDG